MDYRKYMPQSAHCDWWVLGCEPIEGYLLVKCHLTQRTGIVRNPSAEEMIMASANNFTSYPWIEPDLYSRKAAQGSHTRIGQKVTKSFDLHAKDPVAGIEAYRVRSSCGSLSDLFLLFSGQTGLPPRKSQTSRFLFKRLTFTE